jgi:hypothetical protein
MKASIITYGIVQNGSRVVKYVLENPVKAGLVKTWKDWQWNYVSGSLGTPDAN